MLLVHKTISLCHICYRHIPANIVEEDGQILIKKHCPDHGLLTSVVEVDPKFYYELQHNKPPEIANFMEPMLFEVTDRCQLDCPHCYHMPDNKTTDRPLDDLRMLFQNFPKTCFPMLAGAEPTLRQDFIELCEEVTAAGFEKFMVLTNGLKFADKDFAVNAYQAGLRHICFGLNHPDYQGKKVHNKQLKAIDNLIDIGYDITYIGYTLQNLDELPFVLDEIKTINSKLPNNHGCHYRIRCGSFIGRSNDQHRSYLSQTVKKVKELIGDEVTPCNSDDNLYHIMLNWNGILLRLIQWPDVSNIDMEELDTGPWCQFYEGPITNFVHQVITRDAYVNMKMPAPDLVPEKYRYQPTNNKTYWKDSWTGPTEVTELTYEYIDTPIPVKKVIPLIIANATIL